MFVLQEYFKSKKNKIHIISRILYASDSFDSIILHINNENYEKGFKFAVTQLSENKIWYLELE